MLFPVIGIAQTDKTQKSYTTSFESLSDSINLNPKPILIKIYADWCAVCKIQDKKIEKDTAIQKLLSEKVYYLTLNAESKETIVFNSKSYSYKPNGTKSGHHELATLLTYGSSEYPYWVLLSPDYKEMGSYSGLLNEEQLKKVLSSIK
ncbi:hypothetical protein GCM10007424_08600 [Flavobacterium suaedae]|uniref:Thioredoxin-like fold domain-containing protein n=1 Tax=Flavobacterium suaedae TaxID=1767027 RepID=A0ABQ1JJW2_9FLAO|nr:hypothetical protein GCM10007424_08600 [Flavobacterium suaedae]